MQRPHLPQKPQTNEKMASTTKIMTCVLALETGNPEDVLPVSSYAARQPKVHMGVQKGEYYRMEDLLYGLMLESYNDAAVVIAEYYGSKAAGLSMDCSLHTEEESRKAVLTFARKMNEKAKEIGCENTFFITPNGLDAELETDGTQKQHSCTATVSSKGNVSYNYEDGFPAVLQPEKSTGWNV